MVNTRNRWVGAENSQGNGNPPPPPSLVQAIASILESRDEQTELLQQLIANSTRGGNGARNAPAPALTTYSDFAVTHPPLFTEAGEPLEADHWLWVIVAEFHWNPKFQDFPVNFLRFQLIEYSLNFHSNSILNLEKFL
jgi:hypothetical protein